MLNLSKKRIIAMMMSVVLVGGALVGCGGNTETDNTTTGQTTTGADVTTTEGDATGTETDETTGETEEPGDTTSEETTEAFPSYDLGGVTITALNGNSLNNRNPEAEDLEDYEVTERQEHLDAIQDKYNVTVEFVPFPSVEWAEVPNELVRAYTAGTPYADLMDVSYTYLMTLATNGILNDNNDWIGDMPFAERYVETGSWLGSNYGIGTFVGGEGLLYNRAMIEAAGMEFEPNEMFARGMWSYDEFYEYMEELSNNLPEGDFPFFIDPYYWFLFAPSGNGTFLVSDQGVNYQDDAVVETLEFLDRLWDAGLVRDANLTESGARDYWGTPGQTFEQGVEVAMTHRASWQAADLVDSIDFGFVPYPWGSNVSTETVGEVDSYKTLSDNYSVTVYDAQFKTMTNGIADKANPEGVFNMFMELIGHEFIVTEFYATGSDDAEIDPRWFSTELDAELYDWSVSQERMETYAAMSSMFTLASDYYDVFFEDASVRSVIDAATPVDQAAMEEAGYVSAD